jgi:hypothetical protein
VRLAALIGHEHLKKDRPHSMKGGYVKRTIVSATLVSVISLITCASLWAQATADISGTVKDSSGAVLPGVQVTATQTDTGISRTAISNETGFYVLPNLSPGPYRLEASLPGFRTYVQMGVVLQVNASPVINVTLEVGQVSEQVEVQANAALVDTRNSTVGSVIENERVLELPLNGRNVTDLIVAAGGAVDQSLASQSINNLAVGGASGTSPVLSIAGGASWGTGYSLDGASHINYMTGTTMNMPFPDAVQEFKVETSGVNAERGNAAAVSAVTKSGTNQLHGNLFEFVRNDFFNARYYFATQPASYKRNQFGGTAGGAIVPNKLFFFGGYQGTTIVQVPNDTRVFVPTPAILAGDWTAFASPACNVGRQINLRAPFVNNKIDPALYSKAAMFVVKYQGALPFPTTTDPCGQITYGTRTAETDGIYVGKIDYQQNAKHSMFGRVLLTHASIPNPFNKLNNLLQDTGYRSALASSYTFGSTYLVSANVIQAFRLSVNRSANHYYNVTKGQLFNWCDAGVKIYCAPEITRLIQNTIVGAFNLTSGFMTGHRYIGTMYSMDDDVSIVHGNHQMSFGINVQEGREGTLAPYTSAHQFTFNSSATGLGLADFMLGKPSQLVTGRTNPHHITGISLGFYAVDTWKIRPRLTLNYGLRWQPTLAPNVEDIYNFDYNRFLQGIKSSVFVNAPAGLYYRGDPGFPGNGIDSRLKQFGPHLGLAWDVSGDGRTSVRASYAFSYVPVPGDFRERYSGTGPWGGRITLTSPAGGLDNPYLGVPGGDIFPYDVNKNSPYPPYGWIYTQPFDMPTPYQQTWNLSIQRQIGKDWLVSGSYLGNNMIHLWGSQSLNPAVVIPGTCNAGQFGLTAPGPCSTLGNVDARRTFGFQRPADAAKIGYVAGADTGGIQRYNGMLLSLERRPAKGVTVNGNYTWSHCIGPFVTLYDARALWPYETYTNPNNRDADRGNCDTDRRHIFNLTSVAETPQFSNRTMRIVGSGWRLSGIYRISSGWPMNGGTVGVGAGTGIETGSVALTGIYHQRMNQILGNPYSNRSGRPLTQYLNPAAFASPNPAGQGNVGRNSIMGPGNWGLDMGLARVFQVKENQKLEVRAEAYNVTNSFRPGCPSGSTGAAGGSCPVGGVNAQYNSNVFGQIRNSLDPRIMQFALKYMF